MVELKVHWMELWMVGRLARNSVARMESLMADKSVELMELQWVLLKVASKAD